MRAAASLLPEDVATPPKPRPHAEQANAEREVRRPEACSAWGCPLWGAIRLAGSPDWVCDVHALADPTEWQAVTKRLRAMRPLLRIVHQAMQASPLPDWATIAERRVCEAGYPELAPTVRQLRHRFGETMVTTTCDERHHRAVWAQRLRYELAVRAVNPMCQFTQIEP